MNRYRIERAGYNPRYQPGWYVHRINPELPACGVWLPTWLEAIALADTLSKGSTHAR